MIRLSEFHGNVSIRSSILTMIIELRYYVVDKKLFHRAILMSGSDLCEWSTVDSIYDTNAREYTKALGRQVCYIVFCSY